jgi:Fic-DOC domain mobile mystery protein B
LNFIYPAGATPIDPNEEKDLIPSNITTQAELNEAEYRNIVRARSWARGRTHRHLVTVGFLERLHERMFGEVWKWAGTRRQNELQNEKFTPFYAIATETETVLADLRHRLLHAPPNTQGQWDRLGAEFHHRIVKIHYFNNGNGRHARELTDLLLMHYGQEPFTWGSGSLTSSGATRDRYIVALHAADDGDLALLTEFVRS